VGSTATMLLAVLMLRGPQTPGELRLNCERMHKFADISSVEAYLDELAGRSAGAMVVRLPKQPGSREHRWAQLLTGAVDVEAEAEVATPPTRASASGEIAALKDEIAALKGEIAGLGEEVATLREAVEALQKRIDPAP
jgi:uncharacterized protein YceH (UPF0502 family)